MESTAQEECMFFRNALELELIKKDKTEFAYVKKDKEAIGIRGNSRVS
jgi:hypothetical protein